MTAPWIDPRDLVGGTGDTAAIVPAPDRPARRRWLRAMVGIEPWPQDPDGPCAAFVVPLSILLFTGTLVLL